MENTFSILRHNGLDKDHLHLRGEYCARPVLRIWERGSPPLTWRIRKKDAEQQADFRITSTYVENTVFTLIFYFCAWDHLHIRGEYLLVAVIRFTSTGSSPHTWRILSYGLTIFNAIRITSTYVENTLGCFNFHRFDKDHLHIRGEYFKSIATPSIVLGSPPHTWRIH